MDCGFGFDHFDDADGFHDTEYYHEGDCYGHEAWGVDGTWADYGWAEESYDDQEVLALEDEPHADSAEQGA